MSLFLYFLWIAMLVCQMVGLLVHHFGPHRHTVSNQLLDGLS